jgi:hypothetical protein
MAKELNVSSEENKGILFIFNSSEFIDVEQFEDNELMKQLSPHQRQEIMRIRHEGSSRCSSIINQVSNQ